MGVLHAGDSRVLCYGVESLGLGLGDEACTEKLAAGSPSCTQRLVGPYIDVIAYPLPVKTPPSLELSSGLLPVSPAPSIIPSPILSPMIPLTIPTPIASPATIKAEGFLTELEAQVEMQGGLIYDHTRYQLRSLEHEQERVAVTFGAIWRPVLALESWAGQMDAQRASLWHAISDTQMENQELRL
ncbi:hypothetical protein Tco_1438273 [Tanacetum coccineum]